MIEEKKCDLGMVTSCHPPSANFITKRVSPTLPPKPTVPDSLGEAVWCPSIALSLPQFHTIN